MILSNVSKWMMCLTCIYQCGIPCRFCGLYQCCHHSDMGCVHDVTICFALRLAIGQTWLFINKSLVEWLVVGWLICRLQSPLMCLCPKFPSKKTEQKIPLMLFVVLFILPKTQILCWCAVEVLHKLNSQYFRDERFLRLVCTYSSAVMFKELD